MKSSLTIFKKTTLSRRETKNVALDHLHKAAFDNSPNASIVLEAGTGNIIIANKAACKLFGYSKKELSIISIADIFGITEQSLIRLLKQRITKRQPPALLTLIRKNGMPLACEVSPAVFKDGDGSEKVINTFLEVSKNIFNQKNADSKKEKIAAGNSKLTQTKYDERLPETNRWIKGIGKISYNVIWDWNIRTGKICVGDSVEEVFGYRVENNMVRFADISQRLLPEEKVIIERKLLKALSSRKKTWNDSFMFKRYDGSIASIISRASIVRDKEGNATHLTGNTQDISRLQELERRLQEQIAIGKEQNKKFQIAARLSFDGIWDRNLITNELFLGEGFAELFGNDIAMKKGNILDDWSSYLHPEDKASVEKSLQDAIASSATRWEQSYRFVKADGSIAKVFGRATITRDADGKAIRMIGVVHDMSKQKALEEKLHQEVTASEKLHKEYENKFKLIFNSSSDVLFDFDVVTNKLIISGAYEKEFGYKITDNMVMDETWINHVHPDDRESVTLDYQKMLVSDATGWKCSYRFLRADNSIANIVSDRIILRTADGKAYRILGSMRDTGKQKALEERLQQEIITRDQQLSEYKESLKFIFNSPSEVLYDIDIITNEMTLSDAHEKEFGHKITSHMSPERNWISHIHPEDKEALMQDYFRMVTSKDTQWKYSYRFLRADDSVANVYNSSIVLRDAWGIAYRMVGFIQDLSKQKVLEKRLEQEINLNEKQITEAARAVKRTEGLDIIKELDNNVTQLLSFSRLYLDMAKQGGENSERFLDYSSEYSIKAIEKIRKITKEFTTGSIKNPGLCESIYNFARDAMESGPVKITCTLDTFIEDGLNDKFKLDVLGIVMEEVNNILKSARPTEIAICLFHSKKSIRLSISDDGIILDTPQKREGAHNIKNRVAFYNGTADVDFKPGKGCMITIIFPVANALLHKGPGFHRSESYHKALAEKIKKVIVEFAYSDNPSETNFSEYLKNTFHRSYPYLAHLFADVEGITLKKFIISHKIERVKELITSGELNLKEIAWKLNFSSAAHLSNQFRKETGLTPSIFKQLKDKRNIALNYV